MSALTIVDAHAVTRHGIERLRQRGYRKTDLDLILEEGTPAGNAVLLTDRDVAEQVAECRRRIRQLQRLRGTAVVLAGDRVLSVYRPNRRKLKRFLRHRHGRGLGVPRYRDVPTASALDEAWCA
jgi:hypothetical protein